MKINDTKIQDIRRRNNSRRIQNLKQKVSPQRLDGGPGSGNFGHLGIKGQVGGSVGQGLGNVISGKSGDFTAKSPGAKTINTSDCMKEIREGKPNSLAEHLDKDGNLSPERQAVHDEIIRKMFEDKEPASGKPTMVMSGGGPASGKSFIEKTAKADFGESTVLTIDPDKIKSMLPCYTEMAIETEKAAGFYHEESSALAKRAYQYALDNNVNVVYDGTGDGSVKSVESKIDTARDAGYAVKASYVTVDTEEALRRNEKRYYDAKAEYEAGNSEIPPRLPDPDLVREIHQKVSDISIQVANKYDSFELYDNNVPMGAERIKIATCVRDGDIKVEPGQEERMQRYLDKGKSGARIVDGKIQY